MINNIIICLLGLLLAQNLNFSVNIFTKNLDWNDNLKPKTIFYLKIL